MAAPGARMRLTVVVEALAEENAHGEYRDMALAAFKERKFAMPVQLDDSFEAVWRDIEQRYKTNYLSPQQAATFGIKKLQDAYDCDLDMTDTVGAIFEGEPDRKMHLIKVIPRFVYRETSVVPGSMLQPAGAQKRAGDDTDDGGNKRRRIESQQRQPAHDSRDLSPNRPLPSTELQQAAALIDSDDRPARSRSGVSLVELGRNETGRAPFSSTNVKQEFPESQLQPPVANGIDAASPDTPQDASPEVPGHAPPIDDDLPDAEPDSHQSAIYKSPLSSAEPPPAPLPAPVTKSRRDVYHVPSSPDFMHKKPTPEKPAKTYGRSPRAAADLLNKARRLGQSPKEAQAMQPVASAPTLNRTSVFQRPQPDGIESTPRQMNGASSEARSRSKVDTDNKKDEDEEEEEHDGDLTASFLEGAAASISNKARTPARKAANKLVKPGSLKKPSRASLVGTPTSAKHPAKSDLTATLALTKASKTGAKGKLVTSSVAATPKTGKVLGENTMSRMERLEKLLNASQDTSKRRADMSSPARSDSIRSLDRSRKSSPEVRIPVPKRSTPAKSDAATVLARPVVQPSIHMTPIKSPVPFPALKAQKQTGAQTATPKKALDTAKSGNHNEFKKPAAKATESPALSTPAGKTSTSISTATPRRSEVPFPPNVRHLRRSSSLQTSPLSNGNISARTNSPSALAQNPASHEDQTLQAKPHSASNATTGGSANLASNMNTLDDAVVISSAESSSSDGSNLDEGEAPKLPEPPLDDTVDGRDTPAVPQGSAHRNATTEAETEKGTSNDEAINQHDPSPRDGQAPTVEVTPSQIESQPPSGQGVNQSMLQHTQAWSFDNLGPLNQTNDTSKDHNERRETTTVAAATLSEDEGFAEQDIYSTAVEDNASRSRSGSVNSSSRSSPAVSRQPARFLSHSPTPDASESEGDSDDSSQAPSQAVSPLAEDKDDSDSDTESSSASSDNDVETPDARAKLNSGPIAQAVPPSSPPLTGRSNSTPRVPEISQSTPPGNSRLVQQTPIPLPTQQSSQLPRSSQSVSVQAADRRRYTGFRSLREQLADTKAAQATTQKKIFDPRTMSLGKLVKGKSLAALGANDDGSSDDESSSSSSSSDDSD